MGLCFGFRLNPKFTYTVPIHSPHFFLSSSSSAGGREVFFSPTRLSFFSTIYEEGETLHKDFGKTFAFSPSALEAPQKDLLQGGEVTKVNRGKRSVSSVHEMIDNTRLPFGESHFGLLMENLDVLEETFADSEALRLKKNIILQLEKLGALELFNVCLTASSGTSHVSTCTEEGKVVEKVELNKRNRKVDDYTGKVVVQSSKRKENRTRRKGASVTVAPSSKSLPLEDNQEDPLRSSPVASFVKKTSNTKTRRAMIAQREVEMAKGVKVLADLEKMRTAIEEDTKQAVSMSSWAEASGVDEKVLRQQLYHGYYCKEELLRSTRSLVLYFARKYRGMGIALEDLLQVGYIGVLQGAERFDSTRGYQFSTYVQHWIRKSMSKMVAKYARGITVPWSMNKAINQIKKARKVLRSTTMKYPEDHEIAKMTGLSLDRIISASHCLRSVSSMNRGVDYMGYMPDISIESPEKTVMKQQIKKDIHDILQSLDSRERQILILRFGLNDHKPKSLEYIGRIYKVSKAWIWQIEKKALTKLRNEKNISKLNYYLDL
ncbi:hypothetical protein P8452_00815 [Trifolium repens]|nr:hypothetical protein P8452_00815 [Trifolium repens]